MIIYYRHVDGIVIEQCDQDYYLDNSDNAIMVHESGKLDSTLLGKGFYVVLDNKIGFSNKYWAIDRLKRTDWKVTKHRDQIALNITPSMTDEEYQSLLQNRESWREVASD
tara:strand:- start:552 stop:881 length:330 start_codon:yes stop_codon:yes gene_type:complete